MVIDVLRYPILLCPAIVHELSKMNEEKDVKIDGLQKQIDELKAMISGSAKTDVTLTMLFFNKLCQILSIKEKLSGIAYLRSWLKTGL